MEWQYRKNIVGAGVAQASLSWPSANSPSPHRPANNHRTDRRRVKDAAPYGGDGHSFDIQGAAARGCNEYEVLVASLVDKPIKFETSRAARHVLPTSTSPSAPNTPALRDVRRAEKIFSYTVHGAFFFISEKERGCILRTGSRCKTAGRMGTSAPTGSVMRPLFRSLDNRPPNF